MAKSLTDWMLNCDSVIPAEYCSEIIDRYYQHDWETHRWYNAESGDYSSYDTKELDVIIDVNNDPFLDQLNHIGQHCYKLYEDFVGMDKLGYNATRFRLNKYEVGTIMRRHNDHIRSIFDGERKGIPVLTLLAFLNDDYEGGEFKISTIDETIKPNAGSVLVFPSLFMYEHEVLEVKKGRRFTAVSWVF